MKYFLIAISFLILVFSLAMISSLGDSGIILEKGKNFIVFNDTENFYIETLISANPEIEAASYVENGETIGYVNFLGGIGENFVVFPEREYELILKEEINLVLPN